MRHPVLLPLLIAGAAFAACNGSFPVKGAGMSVAVSLTGGDRGAPTKRLPITFTTGPELTLRLEVRDADGSIDTGFDGWIRLSARPGTILPLQRNVRVKGGVADGVHVTVVASYGDARLWAEDVGYAPWTPSPDALPECANGVDDDGDGTIDFPADAGCFSPDDDDERPGTLATGASDVVYFTRPRVADVRGVAQNNGVATAFPHEEVALDTGYHDDTGKFDFDVVVTRVASDGFYVTDVQDQNARGYASVFAFTFSPPQRLAVCDRLRSFAGTASDFYGFTELGSPTWTVEYYDPVAPARPCLVPEPRVFSVADLSATTTLFKYEAALVRLQSGGNVTVHIGKHFGPNKVPSTLMGQTETFTPKDDATSCDLNSSGKVDFSDAREAACATACDADVECSEFTSFLGQSQFRLVVSDGATTGTILGNGSTDPSFDPVLRRGAMLGAFTGTLRYFSGGQQFTLEARCSDDIVEFGAQPRPTDKACVPRSRPELDLNEMSH